MAQKLWRVVRACVELGPKNPIQQIHDQGAGGNCNVVRHCSRLHFGAHAVHLLPPLTLYPMRMMLPPVWRCLSYQSKCLLHLSRTRIMHLMSALPRALIIQSECIGQCRVDNTASGLL